MKKRLEALVTGIVQGVMFRDFTKRSADKLGLSGYVKNQADGSVLLIAEGEEEALKKLVEKLWKGPLLTRFRARVENIETRFSEGTGEFNEFIIIRE